MSEDAKVRAQEPFMESDWFGTTEFAENPESRCPLVLILDKSGSMDGAKLAELNAGLRTLKEELGADDLAAKRVEIAIVEFGPVNAAQSFIPVSQWQPPMLLVGGATPMGSAIQVGLEALETRKAEYRMNGIAFYRPWVFLITDGEPTDDWHPARAEIANGEERRKYAFFAVGVENANMGILQQLSVRAPLRLQGLKFKELFVWLSNSMRAVSRSQPGDQVQLDDPTQGPAGWAVV